MGQINDCKFSVMSGGGTPPVGCSSTLTLGEDATRIGFLIGTFGAVDPAENIHGDPIYEFTVDNTGRAVLSYGLLGNDFPTEGTFAALVTVDGLELSLYWEADEDSYVGDSLELYTHLAGKVGDDVCVNLVDTTDVKFLAASYSRTSYELKQEAAGAGGETCTHTAEIYAPDYLGVYHAFGANAPVWEGFRESAGQYFADDGTGALLDPLPMLVYQPAGTNICLQSRSFNETGWSMAGNVTATADLTGIDGVANAAYTINRPDVTWDVLQNTIPIVSNSNPYVVVAWIKKETAPATYPGMVFNISGGVTIEAQVTVDTANGALVVRNSTPDQPDAVETIDDGDFWKCMIQITDNASGNTVTKTIFYPAVNTDGGDAWSPNAGSFGLDNVEVYANKTIPEVRDLGPIFTTTAAVSTDEIINTWAAANHSDAGQNYEADYKLSGGDQILLSMSGTAVLSVVSGDVVLSDGTNSCSTPVVSAEPHIKATYNRVLGAELIANGDFSNGVAGWTAYATGSTIDAIGEQLNCETTFDTKGFYQQMFGLIGGTEYIVRFDVTELTVATNVGVGLGSGIGNITSGYFTFTNTGHHEYTFIALGDGDLYLSFQLNTVGTISVDNVSFKEVSVAESTMQLDVDGVTATSAYDGTLGAGDLSTKATQRDLIRRGS